MRVVHLSLYARVVWIAYVQIFEKCIVTTSPDAAPIRRTCVYVLPKGLGLGLALGEGSHLGGGMGGSSGINHNPILSVGDSVATPASSLPAGHFWTQDTGESSVRLQRWDQ